MPIFCGECDERGKCSRCGKCSEYGKCDRCGKCYGTINFQKIPARQLLHFC